MNRMRDSLYDEIKVAVEDMPHEREPVRELSAPLFVKVDRYRELITAVQEMKLFAASARDVFSTLHEIEAVRADALNILRAMVQRLEKTVLDLDAELVRPKGVSLSSASYAGAEVEHIESSLSDLQKQLADLRHELKNAR